MAREPDLAGIRQLLKPLEASGTLIRRTDEEVCYLRLPFILHTYRKHLWVCLPINYFLW